MNCPLPLKFCYSIRWLCFHRQCLVGGGDRKTSGPECWHGVDHANALYVRNVWQSLLLASWDGQSVQSKHATQLHARTLSNNPMLSSDRQRTMDGGSLSWPIQMNKRHASPAPQTHSLHFLATISCIWAAAVLRLGGCHCQGIPMICSISQSYKASGLTGPWRLKLRPP